MATEATIEERIITQGGAILVVDDSKTIRLLLDRILKYYSFACDFACNGEEAIARWNLISFDLILMDLNMPVMDGLSAARIIRRKEIEEEREYTPIVAITGQDVETALQQSLDSGMDALISKPFTKYELLVTISSIIEAYHDISTDRQNGNFSSRPL